MGFTPAQVREMTPADTALLVRGWNEAHSSNDDVAPMTSDEYRELVAKYG
jgi:hypothetical protein